MKKQYAVAFVVALFAALSAPAATFTVTTINDNGPGSLRQAILDANALSGPDTINFSIGSGQQIIILSTPLPSIDHHVTIDGSTQPGYAGKPLIGINGQYLTGDAIGLYFLPNEPGHSSVNAIAIGGFRTLRDNSVAISAWAGNFVQAGVGTGTAVTNCYVGIAPDGATIWPNNIGISASAGAVISHCYVAGANFRDIYVTSSSALIDSNVIGRTPSGELAPFTGSEGLIVWGGPFNVITNNEIAGFDYSGLILVSDGDIVRGNRVTARPGASRYEPGIQVGGNNHQIGGPNPGDGNIVTDQGMGIWIGGSGNTVQGNDLSHNNTGIEIYGTSSSNTIGGTTAGAGNYIHDNFDGITVAAGAIGNALLGNRLTANIFHSISVSPSANAGQKPPVITDAYSVGSTTGVGGTLQGPPSRNFRIEIYANSACHASGSGEANGLLGVTSATTDDSGNSHWGVIFPFPTGSGVSVSAIATEGTTNNSSQFSTCATIQGAGLFAFSAASASVSEAAGNVTVTVVRTAGTSGAVTVDYATSDNGSAAGTYTPRNGTLSFAAGETSKTISIPLVNDTTYRGSRPFNVTLSNPTGGAGLGTTTSEIITIQDDDPLPVISLETRSVTEGNSGTTPMTFDFALNTAGGLPITIRYQTFNGSAIAGADFVSVFDTVTIPAGQTHAFVTVQIMGDTQFESNETFTLSWYIEGPMNGSPSSGGATGIIIDDDAKPALSVDDISVVEGNSGFSTGKFTVSLSAPLPSRTTVFYSFEQGSALRGADFVANDGTIAFDPGERVKTISVQIAGDTEVESNETFSVLLTGTCCDTPPALAKPRGTCTILNDDAGLGPRTLNVARGTIGQLFLFLGAAPSTPSTLIVTSSDPSVATVPPTVPVSTSSNSAAIDVTGVSNGHSRIDVTLPAALGGNTLTANVNVFEKGTLTFNPAVLSLPAGTTRNVPFTLSPAPGSFTTLPVRSSNASVVDVASSVDLSPSGAGTLTIRGIAQGSSLVAITLPGANGSEEVLYRVEVTDPAAATQINSVAPATGPSTGGTAVVVTGQNLSAACTVSIGGSAATVSAATPTSLSVVTPQHAAGTVDVTVSCGDGAATLPNAFTYVSMTPQISGVSPSFGAVSGETLVAISGDHLGAACGVFFGGMNAKVLSAANGKMIVSTPPHQAGAVDVSIKCGDATTAAKSAFTYTLEEPAPSISDIDPLAATPGQRVTLKGSRFRVADRVTFGDVPALVVSSTSDTHVVEVPAMPAGLVAINLTDPANRLFTTGPIFTVLDAAAPQITGVTPAKVAPGGEIVIDGRGFRAPFTFALDARNAGSIIDLSFTRATVRVAADTPAGNYALGLRNGDGTIVATGPHVDVMATMPVASSVAPQCASADGGAEITISGNGFAAGAAVTIGGASATNVQVIDAHTIKATVPAGALGYAAIVVTNPNGDAATLSHGFFYYSPFDHSAGCTVSRTRGARH